MYLNRLYCLIGFSLFLCAGTSAQNWTELYSKAQRSFEAQQFEEALTNANQSLLLFKNESAQQIDANAAILRLIQLIHYETGTLEKGLEAALEEVKLREAEKGIQYADALSQAGIFQNGLGHYSEASESFGGAMNVLQQFYQPNELPLVESKFNLGNNLYLAGQTDKAYNHLRKALPVNWQEFTPPIIQGLFFLALIEQEQGNRQQAISNFNLLKDIYESGGLQSSIDYAELLTGLGRENFFISDYQKADELFLQAQKTYESLNEKTPNYYRLLNFRAESFLKAGDSQKAEEIYSAVSPESLDGESLVIVMAQKANVAQTRGQLPEAEKYYREAVAGIDKEEGKQSRLYGEMLQNLAMVLSEQKRSDEALALLEESKQYISADALRQSRLSIKKGIVYLQASDRQNSMTAFQEAVNILGVEKRNTAEWVMAVNGAATVHSSSGNVRAADSVFQVLVAAYDGPTLRKDNQYAIVLNNYAAVKQMEGSIQEAYDLFFKASQLQKKENGVKTLQYASTLKNLAHMNLNRGALGAAKEQIDSALLIFESLVGKKSPQYASAQLTLGRYHQHAGEFPLAEPCFKKSYNTFQQLGNASLSDQVEAINALAVYYQTMGNYEEAGPLFKQIIALLESANAVNSPEYSTTLQNIATLYQMQENYDQASVLLEKALKIDERIFGSSHPNYAITLKNLGALYQKQGKREEAQLMFEDALRVTRQVFGTDHPSYAVTISNLAALFQDQGKYAEAEKYWTQSVALRKQILGEDHPDYARSLYGLANNYFAKGELDKAESYFRVVTAQYLKQIRENFPTLSEKEKGAFYLTIKPVFEAFQDFCVQYAVKNRNSEKASAIISELYEVQLSTKAILLNASSKVRQQILSSNDAVLVQSYKEWLALKETIGRYYTLTADERKGHENIMLLQASANDLEKDLSSKSEAFRSQFSQRHLTPKHIADSLKSTDAAVEIIRIRRKFVADSVYYVGLILKSSQTSPTLVIWPDGTKLENRYYKFHRNAIKFGLEDPYSYKRFWEPISSNLDSVSNIYVSSDGIFNKVNLNALKNPATSRWVIDDFTISLVSNTKEILEESVSVESLSDEVYLYGYIDFNLNMDPTHHVSTHPNLLTRNFGFEGDIPILPGTNKEIEEISTILSASDHDLKAFKRDKATEESIKKITEAKILHVATHGFFMNDVDIHEADDEETSKFLNNPLLRSGLLLAGAGVKQDNLDATTVEDGILTAYEAMNLSLDNTDLVVMSACETGLGEVRNGEGVYGLQRSFLVAGANAVMMSLWQVDDNATQELMVKFYSNWVDGIPKLAAFRKAQIEMKEKYPSPFYWGAFIMIGN